jgi:Fic family protein
MAIVQPPPSQRSVLNAISDVRDQLPKILKPEFQDLIKRANDEYLHWHDFRYKTTPSGISQEFAWAYLKLGRMSNQKLVPFKDKEDKPFSYWIPDTLLKALNEIDRLSGGTILTDKPGSLPPQEQYIISSLMEEAIASSQLEGAATTRKIAKEMLRTGRKPSNKSEQMIVNNWRTMLFIREHRTMKLTPEVIFEIHKRITEETLEYPEEAGVLRTSDNIEVAYREKTVHRPPKASTLQERMEALCNFANHDEEEHWIHPVIKAAMIHFWLAYDHPFTDGNGRTARALMYWYLLSRRYLLFEYLAISRYILKSPGQYVRAYLFTETDAGDLTYFLIYNLRVISLALRDLRIYLTRKQMEIARSNELLRKYKGLNARQKVLVYHAIRVPHDSYTIEAHKNYHSIVYETARNDLLQLVEKGFLRKEKEGKEFIFWPCEGMIDKLRAKETTFTQKLDQSLLPPA